MELWKLYRDARPDKGVGIPSVQTHYQIMTASVLF